MKLDPNHILFLKHFGVHFSFIVRRLERLNQFDIKSITYQRWLFAIANFSTPESDAYCLCPYRIAVNL